MITIQTLPYVQPKTRTAGPGETKQPRGYAFAKDPLELMLQKEAARDLFLGTPQYFVLIDEVMEEASMAASEIVGPNAEEFDSLNEKLFEKFLELRLKTLGL